jgi:hypothetical protein
VGKWVGEDAGVEQRVEDVFGDTAVELSATVSVSPLAAVAEAAAKRSGSR